MSVDDSSIIYIDEAASSRLVNRDLAFAAIRRALIAAASDAVSFPVVIGHGQGEGTKFSLKSATAAIGTGLKIGTYWPDNLKIGIPRHNSFIVLLDDARGGLRAIIAGGEVNAFRTAAADAVAVHALSRADSAVLTIFGAGHQAFHECVAVAAVRPIRAVHVVNRTASRAAELAQRLGDQGLECFVTDPRTAVEAADIIVTATNSTSPLFEAAWVKPGTHVSAMGADAAGKQELPPDLFKGAILTCDLPSQSVRIGEFQHAAKQIDAGSLALVAIGDILVKMARGRKLHDDITIFDSSGVAAQDLSIGEAILGRYLTDARKLADDELR